MLLNKQHFPLGMSKDSQILRVVQHLAMER
ncbi:hypothetical protein SAMN05518855_101948 [Paenibacillus sp. CF384]|nr:hypothetical protein SAMN05518855_101948 [Paenibacillus sp. CF384]